MEETQWTLYGVAKYLAVVRAILEAWYAIPANRLGNAKKELEELGWLQFSEKVALRSALPLYEKDIRETEALIGPLLRVIAASQDYLLRGSYRDARLQVKAAIPLMETLHDSGTGGNAAKLTARRLELEYICTFLKSMEEHDG